VRRLVFPILVACLLAGCGGQLPWQTQAAADPGAEDDAKCRSYGLQPATTEYEKCRAKLADLRAQQEADSRARTVRGLQGRPPAGMDPGSPH
jgi:outer membrane PBP1 activator LpoA protein